ncbi:MAG: dipeptidyl aminopeptidase/acylaminoacyl peptidase [Saprospiraceae bacterium]|jgi:dipeptidyl aminopeptidase/acylaminoacyl peptidase
MKESTPIIDREVFFGNPTIMGAQISPDGKMISFIKPYNGMLNIWVKEAASSFDKAQPITEDQSRPITSYFWSRDSQYILYVQDKGGDENFHVYAVNPHDIEDGSIPKARNISNYEGVRAIIYKRPKSNPDQLIVGLNDRDSAWHDLYAINISSGERTLLFENTIQAGGYFFDLKDQLILITRSTSDAGTEFLIKEEEEWVSIYSGTGEESCYPICPLADGSVYIESNVGDHDLSFLGVLDINNGQVEVLEKDPENKVDFGAAVFSDLSRKLIATVYVGEKSKIYWKDEQFENDHQFLKDELSDAQISWVSGTKDERKWIISANSDIDPGATYFFDRDSRKLEFLYRPRPELPIEHLCTMSPVSYLSKDGLEIPAYLTLPNSDISIQSAIVMPHGGPWVRDTWGYDSYAQFLANRGYAVLQPNFRGSTGYGKDFLNKGELEWGRKMQDDLTTGADFLIKEGYCTSDKVGILGGSYGGYAVLAGLAFTPDIYACGISIVGPSNLFTLLESIPPYWESARAMFHRRMGNPETPEGNAHMKAVSPYFHADKIIAPLLVGQGDNDPRVKTAESNQIVQAMYSHGLEVEYLNFPDEGHGFANPANSMAFIAVVERFLSKHLGGRYQEDIASIHQEIINRVSINPAELS